MLAPATRETIVGKVAMFGSLSCLEGRAGEMDDVLARMVEAARAEPGVEVYSYHRGDGNTYWFFALMADEEAMRAHGQTAAMQAAMAEFMPLAAGRPEVTVTTPVAGIGLDL